MPATLHTYLDAEPGLPDSLKTLLIALSDTCAAMGKKVNTSVVEGNSGALDTENVQGEVQKKLDVIANDMMLEKDRWQGVVRGLASEEMDSFVGLDTGDYLLIFDPIDGSGNLDINGVVGTIFSVLKAPQGALTEADFLKPGRDQTAAGCAIYGPQTTLVLSLGRGVTMFTLSDDGTWVQTRSEVTIPAGRCEFAINMSNHRHWSAHVRAYIDDCMAGKTGVRGVDFNMRWLGSMVGDVHRILCLGGVFLYPVDSKRPEGRLRLMYEANPMAFLIEQASGQASDGFERILDIEPTGLHQRVGVVLGDSAEVRLATHPVVEPAA